MRAWLITANVVALAALAYFGQALAHTKERPAQAKEPRTRVALINLTYVIKYYNKYKTFQKELEEIVKPFQDRDTE
jgi:hypothetical protein